MGAERDHHRDRGGRLERVDRRAQEQRQRQRAGVVGDQHQHPLAGTAVGEAAAQRAANPFGPEPIVGGRDLGDAHPAPFAAHTPPNAL